MGVGGSISLSLNVQPPFTKRVNSIRSLSVKSLPANLSGITDKTHTRMTAGNPPLALLDLPAEILEEVVLRFGAQEILRLRIVMWFHLRCPNVDGIFTSVPYLVS